MKIKAISLHQPHASAVAYLPEHEDILRDQGITAQKTIETRTWGHNYRGPVLICATKNPVVKGLPNGVAIATATIVDCRLMTAHDQDDAQCRMVAGCYANVLADITPVEPFEVSGQQGFFMQKMPEKKASE